MWQCTDTAGVAVVSWHCCSAESVGKSDSVSDSLHTVMAVTGLPLCMCFSKNAQIWGAPGKPTLCQQNLWT